MSDSFALVTGASSGIGLALAEVLADKGHNLILVARRKQKLDALAEQLSHKGVRVEVFAADLANPGAAEKLYQQVVEAGLDVSILVNNAGRGDAGDFGNQPPARMRGTIELNIAALTILTRLFTDKMRQSNGGKILNMASIAGFMPGPGFAVYHASKAYVLSLSEALNVELAGSGITVTASCPGPTKSEFHDLAKTSDMKHFDRVSMMSAKRVATEAYDAMKAGEPFVVHGLVNRLLTVSPKLMPRRWLPKMVGRLMKMDAHD